MAAGTVIAAGNTLVTAGNTTKAYDNAFGTGTVTMAAGTTLDFATQGILTNNIALTGTGIVSVGSSQVMELDGIISDADATIPGALAVSGGGYLILGADNTYTGGTVINGGRLQVGGFDNSNAGSLGSGNVLDNGILTFLRTAATTVAGNISGTGVVQIGGSFPGGLPTGVSVTLSGSNTYSGPTNIGSLSVLVAGSTTGLSPSSAFSLASNSGIRLNGFNSTIGSLAGSSSNITIANSSATSAVLTMGGNNTLFSGKFVDGTGGGSLGLTKVGTGNVFLSGIGNTYTGITTISDGTLTLMVNASIATSSGVVDNGTLDISRIVPASASITTLSGSGNVFLGPSGGFGDKGLILTAGSGTFSGIISGTGSLTQLGNSVQALAGANTYSGGTTISGGFINFASLANFGTGNVTLNGGGLQWAAGSTVDVSARLNALGAGGGSFDTNGNAVTLASVVSGAGTVTKAGSGALTLAASNTYTGATAVNAGALNVTGSIASSSGVTVASGATLSGTGTVSSTIIQSGGTLSAGGASVSTLNVSGNLVLNGGANTQMDVTTASADKMAVSGTAAIDGTLNVAFASGSYVPTQYALITSTGALSGTFSSLNLTGASSGLATRLVYDANNVFLKLASGFAADANFNIDSGATDVTSNQTTGGISGTGGSINIADATLTNNQTGASTFAGVFAGSGVFTQAGSGTLILNGNSSGFAGTTTVSGSLEVGDAAHPGASLGGTVNVNQGGTLGGHGTVSGSVTNAGVTAPGGSIGTLTVAGNYSFASGASLQQEVAANGAADLLKVGGAVSIAGNTTLQVLAADPVSSYARVTNYTVVTGAGGISGSFTNVTSMAGLTSIVSYAPGAVNLTVVRNDISLATLATTVNQAGVGAAISADPGSALFAAVAPLGNAQMPSVLASLSGEIHASVRSAAIEDGRILRQSVLDELTADPQSATAVWGSLFASSGHIDSDRNAASVNHTNGGGIVGIDTMLGGGLRAGVAGAYSSHSVSVVDRASHASGTSGHVLAYAGWSDAALHLRAGVDFGWGGDDILRNVGQLAETNASHQNLSTAQIFGEAGYSFQTGLGTLEPYAQIAWLEARSGSFAETGGALSSLRGGAASNAVAYGGFGLRARFRAFDLGDGMNLTPHLELGLQHAFNTFLPSQTLLVGAGSFLASGVPLPGDAATVGAGIDLALSPAARLSIGYDGTLASQAQNHAVRAQIRWALQ